MLAGTVRRLQTIAIALCAALALASVGVPAAGAAALSSSQLGELAKKAQEEEASSTAHSPANVKRASEEEAKSPISSTVAILGVAAIVVLLGGIAFVIVRDARSVAPAVDGPVEGTVRKSEAALRKRRAKARAARAQRKRNR
jgi:hypothetical protein